MTRTRQPRWVVEHALGDIDPVNGAFYVFRDATGVYPPEAEICESDGEDATPETFTIWRFPLDRHRLIAVDTLGEKGDGKTISCALVSEAYDPDDVPLGRHPEEYAPWFARELGGVATSLGEDTHALVNALCSESTLARAWAYRSLVGYHGADNFDAYPIRGLSAAEVNRRYRSAVKTLLKRARAAHA